MPDADPLAPLLRLEGVPSAFAATRDGIDALLRDRGLRRTSPDADRRGAAARRPRVGGPGGFDVLAGGGPCGRGRRGRRRRGAGLGAPASLVPTLRPPRCRPSPACTRWPRATPSPAGPATPPPSTACRPWADCWTATDGRPGPAGGRGACTPTWRRAAPFPSHNGIVARAAERLVLGRARRRRALRARAGGRPPRAAGGVRVEPAGVPRRRSRRRARLAAVRRRGGRRGCRGEPAGAATAAAATCEPAPDVRRVGCRH